MLPRNPAWTRPTRPATAQRPETAAVEAIHTIADVLNARTPLLPCILSLQIINTPALLCHTYDGHVCGWSKLNGVGRASACTANRLLG